MAVGSAAESARRWDNVELVHDSGQHECECDEFSGESGSRECVLSVGLSVTLMKKLLRKVRAIFPGQSAALIGMALVTLATDLQAQAPFTDANWIGLGGYSGANGPVYAAAANQGAGLLYVAGNFNYAGETPANSIAAWNGKNWLSVGSGITSRNGATVYALAMDSAGNIYAGGMFTNAGGITASNVAKWDGSNWTALGTGVDATISTLAVDGSGILYAGGQFKTAGGVSANRIAKWDGRTWTALGS